MEEKKETACLEKKEMKRVDGILSAGEHVEYKSEENITCNEMLMIARKRNPNFVPTGCCIYNDYGRGVVIPWAEALGAFRKRTKWHITPYLIINQVWCKISC
jgi:hypothetical protein